MYRNIICLMMFFCLAQVGFGQMTGVGKIANKRRDTTQTFVLHTHMPQTDNVAFLHSKRVLYPLPDNFYTNHLSFFCKKELQIEKAIKFPVKMRLGSVTYTDRLEGKITARGTE